MILRLLCSLRSVVYFVNYFTLPIKRFCWELHRLGELEDGQGSSSQVILMPKCNSILEIANARKAETIIHVGKDGLFPQKERLEIFGFEQVNEESGWWTQEGSNILYQFYGTEEEFRKTYRDAGINVEKKMLQLKELQINCFFDVDICILVEELAVTLADVSEPEFSDESVEAAYRRAGEE